MYGFGTTPEAGKKFGGTDSCFPMNGNQEDPTV